jgi:hypothetical protein
MLALHYRMKVIMFTQLTDIRKSGLFYALLMLLNAGGSEEVPQ